MEKEALRITQNGNLALTPHPEAFGDKINNPHVKTDFSESQIELVTPAGDSIEETFSFLTDLQASAGKVIGSELLWPMSMPGPLPPDEDIPVARYNGSYEGRLKEIYREGLVARYGIKMQMISGIHYNYSFSPDLWDFLYRFSGGGKTQREFTDDAYFALARNFLRYRWLLIYLFGASPVAEEKYEYDMVRKCRTYAGGCDSVEGLSRCGRYATSLRMSPFGYDTTLQNNVVVSYDSLGEYIRDLRALLSKKSSVFTGLGLYKNGRQIQLNGNQLQLENEYYAPIRFKQIVNPHESQLDKLEQKGINHIELRIFDLNPFEKTGISLSQMLFIHLFAVYCLFEKSPAITREESVEIALNAHLTALTGRAPGMTLTNNNNPIAMGEWGDRLFRKFRQTARVLDGGKDDGRFMASAEEYYENFIHPDRLPSARMVREMAENKEDFTRFGLRRARANLSPGAAFTEKNSDFSRRYASSSTADGMTKSKEQYEHEK